MKPLLLLISTFAAPVLAFGSFGSLPGYADSAVQEKAKISSATSQQLIWIKVALPITIEQLASKLGLKATELSKLNKKSSDTELSKDSWIVLPRSAHSHLRRISNLDSEEVLLHNPLKSHEKLNNNSNRLSRLLEESNDKNSLLSLKDLNQKKPESRPKLKFVATTSLRRSVPLNLHAIAPPA